MTIYSHPVSKQAHLHLPAAELLTEAQLVAPSGETTRIELQAHDSNHYMLRWRPELPAGLYQLKLRSESGQFMIRSMRIH